MLNKCIWYINTLVANKNYEGQFNLNTTDHMLNDEFVQVRAHVTNYKPIFAQPNFWKISRGSFPRWRVLVHFKGNKLQQMRESVQSKYGPDVLEVAVWSQKKNDVI